MNNLSDSIISKLKGKGKGPVGAPTYLLPYQKIRKEVLNAWL